MRFMKDRGVFFLIFVTFFFFFFLQTGTLECSERFKGCGRVIFIFIFLLSLFTSIVQFILFLFKLPRSWGLYCIYRKSDAMIQE